MAVFRIEKTRDYTVMSNHHLLCLISVNVRQDTCRDIIHRQFSRRKYVSAEHGPVYQSFRLP